MVRRCTSRIAVSLLIGFLVACSQPAQTNPTPVPTLPPSPTISEPSGPTVSPTARAEETLLPTESQSTPTAAVLEDTPVPTIPLSTTGPESRPKESILILEPGPGSLVTSPVHLAGESESTFEQSLAVRLFLVDGTELASTPVQIQSELGQRGPFEVEIPFQVDGQSQGVIQVYSLSPRDGGITHLASVGVTFAGSGEADIRPIEDHLERIVISTPAMAQTISGGTAHVEGVALASFEQALVAEVYDQDGKVIGMQSVTVTAPDVGQPGPFSADVPYQLTTSGPGRIVVRDPSPAFDGDLHLSSVEVNLEP